MQYVRLGHTGNTLQAGLLLFQSRGGGLLWWPVREHRLYEIWPPAAVVDGMLSRHRLLSAPHLSWSRHGARPGPRGLGTVSWQRDEAIIVRANANDGEVAPCFLNLVDQAPGLLKGTGGRLERRS